MANLYSVALQAIDAYKKINDAAKYVLPEDIEKIVRKHAAIAVATAFIPVGGLDLVAATANVWTMYVRINNALGVKFSDNKMKSIGSAVVSNLVQNLGVAAVAMALKWNPISYIASVAVLTGALYGLTITSGWVYLNDNIGETVPL